MQQSGLANVFIGAIFDSFLLYWKIWLFLFMLLSLVIFVEILIPLFLNRRRVSRKFNETIKWSSDQEMLSKIRIMKPNEFEEFVSELYTRLGFKTVKVGGAYDGGVDVIASKNGIAYYIQCKKYIIAQVSVGDVRDFAGALIDKLSQGKGIFITTNIFTTEAEKYVEGKPIELIDGSALLSLIKTSGIIVSSKASEEIHDCCPKCGGNMIKKKGRFGEFYGCSNYPKCDFTHK